jgi:lysyl-tRNA synthetase class 2
MPQPRPQPSWHPDRFADRIGFLRRRARLAQGVRAFFDARGYLEVETPYAVATPGEEVHLRALATARTWPDGSVQSLWLHTSPEFAMKRLLVAGAGRVFQLARVWRDNEAGTDHQTEFTMLEWYRPGATMADLMDEVEALLRAVLPPILHRGAEHVDLAAFERLTLQDAFARYAGTDLLGSGEDAASLARSAGTALRPGETWEDVFFRLLLTHVEPAIGRRLPTFLTHYPAAQAALARRDPEDPRVAERFELFVAGLELCNAFIELTDSAEQRQRFLVDRDRRHALNGGADWSLDEDFLAALAHGLPPCGGVALGFDRLAMLASGAAQIGQVQFMPLTARSE